MAVARAAKEALRLDEVLFAPVGTQPLKPAGPTAGFEDRVAMTRLAIEGGRGGDCWGFTDRCAPACGHAELHTGYAAEFARGVAG